MRRVKGETPPAGCPKQRWRACRPYHEITPGKTALGTTDIPDETNTSEQLRYGPASGQAKERRRE